MKSAALFVPIVMLLSASGLAAQTPEKPKGYTYQTLDIPGADASLPQAVNARGDIAGWYNLGGIDYAFLLRNGKLQTIAPPDPRATATWILGISEAGILAGVYHTPDPCPDCPWFLQDYQQHGFIWKDGVYDLLDFPGSVYSNGNGVNARGDVVGEMWLNGKVYGFTRAKDGTYTQLDESEAPEDLNSWSSAYGLNDHGDVAGWIGRGDTFEFYAYFLHQGKLTPIRVPGSTWATASWVNTRGEVAIYCSDIGKSYVWRDGVLTEVAAPDAVWTWAWSINDEGTIVGQFGTADGKVHGFVAYR
jgi:uncharacterized membrane protein